MALGKQYLIQFLATIEGNKIVVRGLKQMEQTQKKLDRTTKRTGRSTQRMSALLLKAGKRALIVAPMWLLLRSVMMGVIRTISDMVSANLDLQDGLARIKTVMHGTADVVEAEMAVIRTQIKDMAVKSNKSIKELAEAFYFLKTSNLDAEEAMAAFIPTVNAMTGTSVQAKEMARAVAGVYNTMGKYIGENLTVTEKFTKIADVLTHTFATQDVEMSELIQSYTKFAPYATGLNDSFTDIVTTLGFLNTRLLRAGRAGRLTGRTILQLSKNAKQLAAIFGISFDPDAPMNLYRTLELINKAMNKTGRLTVKQGQALQAVFATRGAVPVRLLIESFDDWSEALRLAAENADGFAEKIAKIRLHTVRAQMQRMKNIIAILANDFFSAGAGTGDFVENLESINSVLAGLREPIRDLGLGIGWVVMNFAQLSTIINKLTFEGRGMRRTFIEMLFPFAKLADMGRQMRAFKELGEAGLFEFVSFDKYVQAQTKAVKNAEKMKEEGKKTLTQAEIIKEVEEFKLNALKNEAESMTHITKLMKSMGAEASEIANFKLESLKASEHLYTQDDYNLELTKRQNVLLQAQFKYRRDLVKTFQTAEINILKIQGATESDILEVQERQLKNQKEIITAQNYDTALLKIRLKERENEVRDVNTMINHELELLRIRGASQLELIKARLAVEETVYGSQREGRELELKLQLEREITRQKLLQVGYSSDTIKIYQIAKKHGVRVASEIADIIAGRKEVDEYSFSSAKALFRRYFPQKWQTREMRKFFEEGAGRGIRVPERITGAEIRQISMEIPRVAPIPPIPVHVRAEVHVKTDKAQIEREVEAAVQKALRKKKTQATIQRISLDAED